MTDWEIPWEWVDAGIGFMFVCLIIYGVVWCYQKYAEWRASRGA